MTMPRALILVAALALLAAPTASAATISYSGDTLVFSASPGEQNFVVVDGDDQQVTFTDDYPIAFPSDRCSQADPEYPVACDTPARLVRIDLGDGADHGSFGFSIPADRSFEIDGGPGSDLLTGPRNGIGTATLDGGDGSDDLRSEETADTLLGGTGEDKLSAGKGADVLHGGDGNDLLRDDDGLTPAADVLDGGPGIDKFDAYRDGDPAVAAPVDILLDGLANDGRPARTTTSSRSRASTSARSGRSSATTQTTSSSPRRRPARRGSPAPAATTRSTCATASRTASSAAPGPTSCRPTRSIASPTTASASSAGRPRRRQASAPRARSWCSARGGWRTSAGTGCSSG
jgi:Ca2+-binding RTX toxin-like protein